ncbi:hypothetical protein D9756_001110 [Leucocoprinus leucothites]|uniref:Laccase n=1 Tax=Leucocoprinus leucothites TaxID=201217 RepID=A0A8H5LP72_9AGAR|nr:hypothetical protein D9756_001110 [Leucoagaricus leucothites]
MYIALKFSTVLLSVAFVLGETIGRQGTLTLSNAVISPDGRNRTASVLNGIHPGPLISINKGDSVEINVVNQLTNADMIVGTSIHWHGMFQRKTNFMDGTEGVTQCPIAPGNSFLYKFDTEEVGTYWYHSHFGEQYCDGIRGGFIVYDRENDPHKDMYDVDDESTVISISEWYHSYAVSLRGIVLANSTLINGVGRYVGGPPVPLSVVKVDPGKRYRLRLISMSCAPYFTFSIDNHDLTVIEVEGTPIIPYTVNTIPLYAGQRYSVVLNANQPTDNYWIRALPDSGWNGLEKGFDGGVNSAILRYTGAPDQEPTTSEQSIKIPLDETLLDPLTPTPAPGKPEPKADDVVNQYFNFTFNQTTNLFEVNGTSFGAGGIPTPALVQILSGARPPRDLLPEGSIFYLERNQTVQVDFPALPLGGPHPLHLHGHTFWVVKSADKEYDFKAPIIRDTVNGGATAGDIVSIRFNTDNPGPWIFHCHIDFHLKEGFAFVFAEAPDDIQSYQDTPPAAWQDLCPIWGNQTDVVKHAGQDGGH